MSCSSSGWAVVVVAAAAVVKSSCAASTFTCALKAPRCRASADTRHVIFLIALDDAGDKFVEYTYTECVCTCWVTERVHFLHTYYCKSAREFCFTTDYPHCRIFFLSLGAGSWNYNAIVTREEHYARLISLKNGSTWAEEKLKISCETAVRLSRWCEWVSVARHSSYPPPLQRLKNCCANAFVSSWWSVICFVARYSSPPRLAVSAKRVTRGEKWEF